MTLSRTTQISSSAVGVLFAGVTVGNSPGTTSNIVGNLPSGLQEGDLVISSVACIDSSSTPRRPSGYSALYSSAGGGTSTTRRLWVSYKFMGATPDTTFTIVGGTGATGNTLGWTAHAFRGVSQVDPFGASATTSTAASTAILTGLQSTSGSYIFGTAGRLSESFESTNTAIVDTDQIGNLYYYKRTGNSSGTNNAYVASGINLTLGVISEQYRISFDSSSADANGATLLIELLPADE